MERRKKMLLRAGLWCVLLVVAFWAARLACLRIMGNEDIYFYGQLLDANGRPVQGAVVTMQVETVWPTRFNWRTNASYEDLTAETDANGRISISGGYGVSLRLVRIHTFGDLTNDARHIFNYSSQHKSQALFAPDPDHPVVWRLSQ